MIPLSTPGDWPQDFHLENGNYLCKCCRCGEKFHGHKRRVLCKVCDDKIDTSAPPTPQSSAEELAREIASEVAHQLGMEWDIPMNQVVRLDDFLIPHIEVKIAPLFTRLQESDRVLGECVKALETCNSGNPMNGDFLQQHDTKLVKSALTLATTHLNKP